VVARKANSRECKRKPLGEAPLGDFLCARCGLRGFSFGSENSLWHRRAQQHRAGSATHGKRGFQREKRAGYRDWNRNSFVVRLEKRSSFCGSNGN
jgi:hypothetical protein